MELQIAADCNNYKLVYLESGVLFYTQTHSPRLHMTSISMKYINVKSIQIHIYNEKPLHTFGWLGWDKTLYTNLSFK